MNELGACDLTMRYARCVARVALALAADPDYSFLVGQRNAAERELLAALTAAEPEQSKPVVLTNMEVNDLLWNGVTPASWSYDTASCIKASHERLRWLLDNLLRHNECNTSVWADDLAEMRQAVKELRHDPV